MSPEDRQLLRKIRELPELDDFQVTCYEAVRGTCIGATAILVSSLLLGPVGFLVGGVIGGGAAMAMARRFKPLPRVIMENLTPRERIALVSALRRSVEFGNISELVSGSPLALAAVTATVSFFETELGRTVFRQRHT